jgi:opacity protein-like surface antigen
MGKIGLAYRFGGDDTPSAMAAMPAKAAAGCCDRWTGFSAGVYASGGAGHVQDAVASTFGSTNTDSTQTPPATAQTFQSASNILSGKMSGGTVDLFAGYNRHLGNWVVGGQIEGTIYSNIALKSSTGAAVFTGAALDEVTERQQLLRSQVGLIGRAGFLASPNLLLYGLGGLTLGNFNYPDNDFSQLVGGENGTWAVGYTAGAGAELKLTDRWSLRGEYRYTRFGFSRSDSRLFSSTDFSTFNDASVSANSYHTSAGFNVGKVGIAYGFPVLGQ